MRIRIINAVPTAEKKKEFALMPGFPLTAEGRRNLWKTRQQPTKG